MFIEIGDIHMDIVSKEGQRTGFFADESSTIIMTTCGVPFVR
jgi:hypothetical protein